MKTYIDEFLTEMTTMDRFYLWLEMKYPEIYHADRKYGLPLHSVFEDLFEDDSQLVAAE